MRPPARRLVSKAPLATGAAAALLYLASYSYRHNFDGVACAIAVELGDFKHLVHGNHLLYGLMGWAFHRALGLLGMRLGALSALQILDSLLGAAAVGCFHDVLLRAGLRPRTSALAAAGLAVSYGFWLWSVEAQVYALGALLLVLALRAAAQEDPDPARVGLWHGAAMLSHLANALLAPALVWLLWRPAADRAPRRGSASSALGNGIRGQLSRSCCRGEGRWDAARRRRLGEYAAVSGCIVAIGYAAAGVFLVRPGTWRELRLWLLGSLALSADRAFLWHGGWSLSNARLWLGLSAKVLSPAAWISVPLWAWALWHAAQSSQERLPRACLLWLAAYACLFVSWEPFTVVYRVSDLLPLWFLLASAASRADGSSRRPRGAAGSAALAAFVAALAWYNGAREMAPATRPESNVELQRSLWIGKVAPDRAWIAIDGVGQVYVPYFAHRRPLNLRYFEGKEAGLDARLEALAASGEPVLVPSWRLTPPWDSYFRGRRLQEASSSGEWALWRVGPKVAPTTAFGTAVLGDASEGAGPRRQNTGQPSGAR